MWSRSLRILPGLILAFSMTGCGGGSEPTVPVGGRLLIDDGPLDGVVVTFIPETSMKNRRGGSGTTDEMGHFDVAGGLPAGKYTLAYSRRRLPDGSAGPKPGKASDPGIILVETLPDYLVIPDPKVPATQVEIPKEGNDELELKASKNLRTGLTGPGISN